MLVGAEAGALTGTALIAIIAMLGCAAEWFAGTGFTESLLPFAGSVLLLTLTGSLALRLWWWLRARLQPRVAPLPALLALGLLGGAGWFASSDMFRRELANLRSLVGGTEEAERAAIAHQVFAAYRRSDLTQMQRLLERAQAYLPVIRQAAEANGVDEEVLVGIGAAESSFSPRDSKDGGRGLFQITAPPKGAIEAVKQQLGTDRPDPFNHRHNAFLGAATLRHYLRDMEGDLFLGLLAYNIGPRNGGLRSIMNQYGARDFVTIQPYLKNLPRDYPIRVLTAALAYRLWRIDGKLPRYEEGSNARHIQAVGIPGLGETLRASRKGGAEPPA
ncbi:Transglycosylase SLT domain-containing protein [Candidatus Methylocalor cossyra]|uniref:Transglycosylase SLT domain-containing protein n=1 Tax=Candidatus Methylocalor cossyra TaxID=3108543 RepID=A0ABM9NLR5_9GAMM